MKFLRVFGLTRFAESRQTRSAGASCARRRTSTRFPQAKIKVSGIWGTVNVRHGRSLLAFWHACLQHACLSTRWLAPVNRTGANERSRELTLATRCDVDARFRCGQMALMNKAHGEGYYGAHRLPAGKTAAEKRERGRPAGQVAKLFEGRLLQVSKAFDPCEDF